MTTKEHDNWPNKVMSALGLSSGMARWVPEQVKRTIAIILGLLIGCQMALLLADELAPVVCVVGTVIGLCGLVARIMRRWH